MNTIWSSRIQGVETLYGSRKLRFCDRFAQQYMGLLGLDPQRALNVLEIGCGPGALAGALHRWYPRAQITATDRDSAFIQFAQCNEPGITFLEADAAALPFADGVVDVTISNTVAEHVEPGAFYGEQYRVLKPGGQCIVLTTRKTIRAAAQCMEDAPFEIAFWEKVNRADDTLERYAVGRYAMNEAQLPAAMEKYGFSEVRTGFITVALTPDDAGMPETLALEIIESDRRADLEALERVRLTLPQLVSDLDIDEMKRRTNEKYDLRLRQYRQGEKQWDTTVSVIMAVCGVKTEL